MSHEPIDRASLEMARRIADGLPEHPEWIDFARNNLKRWSQRNAGSPHLLRCYDEWLTLLELGVAEVRAILTAETDNRQRLRQNTPFCGHFDGPGSLGNQSPSPAENAPI